MGVDVGVRSRVNSRSMGTGNPRESAVRWFSHALGVAMLLFAFGAQAQTSKPLIEVTPGKARAFRAAVQRFAPPEGATADQVDGLRDAIAAGLEFNGIILPLDRAAFLGPERTVDLEGASRGQCSDWTQSGADALVEGAYVTQAGDLVIDFQVWDTARCKALGRKQVTRTADDLHRAGAVVADEIVALFTGTRGVASTEIAFVSDREGHNEVMVISADGSNPRFATRSTAQKSFPGWLPTGDALVYTAYREHAIPRLYLTSRGVSRPGPLLRDVLPDTPMYRGVVSPEGRAIAIVASYEGAAEIFLVRRNGRGLQRLTHSRAIEVSPAFSPDGEQMAFVSDRSGSPQIYVSDADGRNARRLTYQGNYNSSPAWSPDGRWIAYATMVESQFDIWLIDPTGEVSTPLVVHPRSDEYPSWSPDSRKVVFSSKRRGRADLYVIDVASEAITRLTKDAGHNKNPAWGPWPAETGAGGGGGAR